jgi:hypothetical protein
MTAAPPSREHRCPFANAALGGSSPFVAVEQQHRRLVRERGEEGKLFFDLCAASHRPVEQGRELSPATTGASEAHTTSLERPRTFVTN